MKQFFLAKVIAISSDLEHCITITFSNFDSVRFAFNDSIVLSNKLRYIILNTNIICSSLLDFS